jgi:lipase chaperone LimK
MKKIIVSEYSKNKKGEIKLLKDLFEVIKKALGADHQGDTLEAVLHSGEMSSDYFEQYVKFKKEGIVEIEETDTPCGKTDNKAISDLQDFINKRIDIASLSTEQRKLFTRETRT